MEARKIPAIYIRLKPSYLMLGCYVLISIISSIGIFYLPIGMGLKITAWLVIIIAAIYSIMRDILLKLPWSWRTIEVSSVGVLSLVNARNQVVKPNIKPSSFNHPFLIVLQFSRTHLNLGLRASLWITPLQVEDKHALRKLRVWLNWGDALKNEAPSHLKVDV